MERALTWEFQAVLAKEWISFVDETQQNTASDNIEANALDLVIGGHRPSAAPSSKRNYCCVCKIEENIIATLDSQKKKHLEGKVSTRAMEEEMSWKYDLGPSSRTKQHLCQCLSDDCTHMCHIVQTESNQRMIFTLNQF